METVSVLKGSDPRKLARHAGRFTSSRDPPRPQRLEAGARPHQLWAAAHGAAEPNARPRACHFSSPALGQSQRPMLGLPWPGQQLLAPLPSKDLVTARGVLGHRAGAHIAFPSLVCPARAPLRPVLHTLAGADGGMVITSVHPPPRGLEEQREPGGDHFGSRESPRTSSWSPRGAPGSCFCPRRHKENSSALGAVKAGDVGMQLEDCLGPQCQRETGAHHSTGSRAQGSTSRLTDGHTGLHLPRADAYGSPGESPSGSSIAQQAEAALTALGGQRTPPDRKGMSRTGTRLYLPRPPQGLGIRWTKVPWAWWPELHIERPTFPLVCTAPSAWKHRQGSWSVQDSRKTETTSHSPAPDKALRSRSQRSRQLMGMGGPHRSSLRTMSGPTAPGTDLDLDRYTLSMETKPLRSPVHWPPPGHQTHQGLHVPGPL